MFVFVLSRSFRFLNYRYRSSEMVSFFSSKQFSLSETICTILLNDNIVDFNKISVNPTINSFELHMLLKIVNLPHELKKKKKTEKSKKNRH